MVIRIDEPPTVATTTEHAFLTTVSDALSVAEQRARRTSVQEKVQQLQTRLRAWWALHQDAIRAAYLGWNGRLLSFVVVQNQEPINEPLEASLIDLDLEIVQTDLIAPLECHVLLLPDSDAANINAMIAPGQRQTVSPHANP